jgi:hypothetical protein
VDFQVNRHIRHFHDLVLQLPPPISFPAMGKTNLLRKYSHFRADSVTTPLRFAYFRTRCTPAACFCVIVRERPRVFRPEPSRLLAWGLVIDAHLRDPRCELPLAQSPSLREDFRAVSESHFQKLLREGHESRVQKGFPTSAPLDLVPRVIRSRWRPHRP